MASSDKAAPQARPKLINPFNGEAPSSSQSVPVNPSANPAAGSSTADGKKKKKHRAGKKRRNRRQSFAATADETDHTEMQAERPSLVIPGASHSEARETFYRLGRANRSNTSLESEALLDHRDTGALLGRRRSVQVGGSTGHLQSPSSYSRASTRPRTTAFSVSQSRSRLNRVDQALDSEEDEDDPSERTHLLSASYRGKPSTPRTHSGYGLAASSPAGRGPFGSEIRRPSQASSERSGRRKGMERSKSFRDDDFDVNNPPSMPSSPKLGANMHYDDLLLAGEDVNRGRSPESKQPRGETLIDIDGPELPASTPTSPGVGMEPIKRRMTMARAEEDVCFPQELLSEIAEEDYRRDPDQESYRVRRRRRRVWPELSVLEDWATEEKEQRTIEGVRARKVSEPLMVGGRLRPRQVAWHRDQEDAPFRFTYFNEEFTNTVHAQTISELVQSNQTFKDLFVPEPPVLSESSSEEDEDHSIMPNGQADLRDARLPHPPSSIRSPTPSEARTRTASRDPSMSEGKDHRRYASEHSTAEHTPIPLSRAESKPKRYGPRPVFWLDVLAPTDAEMKVLSKAFGIHPLTAEDIMMQEAREKVELFRHYYFVNYRSFEQDANNEEYMEPVNMYVVVFREGVISFHFSQTPHPANVRRRIRQLSDYLFLTTDWISYAIIDDVTDAYAPLIQRIEEEVDEIDEDVLALHAAHENKDKEPKNKAKDKNWEYEKHSDAGDKSTGDMAGQMLRRVGETRKKVMSLYRLLGNKADVIKGFAKRCNEQWEIAPRSEIGLYLGDIQDHIVTMTGNLSHYENLLSRAHSNYLAQINIRMNERAEQTNDVLGKLTVLGTIVLPMNIVTGLWGMNCLVPGQDVDSLTWFWCLTGGLFVFGISCYLIAKRLYGIV